MVIVVIVVIAVAATHVQVVQLDANTFVGVVAIPHATARVKMTAHQTVMVRVKRTANMTKRVKCATARVTGLA